jgi:hypothetical protein
VLRKSSKLAQFHPSEYSDCRQILLTPSRSLEEHNGKRIKEDKITQWALLEICEQLHSMTMALHQANLPKFGYEGGVGGAAKPLKGLVKKR